MSGKKLVANYNVTKRVCSHLSDTKTSRFDHQGDVPHTMDDYLGPVHAQKKLQTTRSESRSAAINKQHHELLSIDESLQVNRDNSGFWST